MAQGPSGDGGHRRPPVGGSQGQPPDPLKAALRPARWATSILAALECNAPHRCRAAAARLPPLFNRYESGNTTFGAHVTMPSAVFGTAYRVRTDLCRYPVPLSALDE